MNTTVCTLFEGHYHLGVGALVNSLVAAGYRGTVWAGYRGALPPWAAAGKSTERGFHQLDLPEGIAIVFVPLKTSMHFTFYKPDFLDRVLDDFAPDCEAALYIDPDIVVKCAWPLLALWPFDGAALVQDVHSSMPPRHPMRLAWHKFFTSRGVAVDEPRDRYYNAGFVGIARSQRGFLTVWRRIIEIVMVEIGSGSGIKHGAVGGLFHTPDQDAMNIALMACSVPVNAAGSDGMDFETGGYLLSHAIGSPKPWRGGFIRNALRGFSPSLATKAFMGHAVAPLRLFEPAYWNWLKFTCAISSLIGRFYRRA